MPIYEFQCPECLQEFDQLAGFGEEEAPCVKCGKTARRVHKPSYVAVKFKAPGFYKTRHMEEE